MSCRAVVVVLLAFAIAPMAFAGQPSPDVLPHHTIALDASAFRPTFSVRDLFAEVADVKSEVWADGTIVASVPTIDIVVARVSPDGGIETACLATEKSVTEFLTSESKKRVITAAPSEK